MDIEILKSYVVKGYSARSIGKMENLSATAITYWLNKHRIKTNQAKIRAGGSNCITCGETDPVKFKNCGKGRKAKSVCSSCHNARMGEIYKDLKIKGIEYLGGKCNLCGYHRCVGSLHFHHRDPNEKSLDWNTLRHHNWERLKVELDKCDLVCANCHGEIHWGRSMGSG